MAFDFKGKKYWDEMSGTAEVTSSSGRLESRWGLLVQTRLSKEEKRSNRLPVEVDYSCFMCEKGQRFVIPLASFTPDKEQGVATSSIVGKLLRGLRDQCDGLANERDVRMGDPPDILQAFEQVNPGGFREVIGAGTPRPKEESQPNGTSSAHSAG